MSRTFLPSRRRLLGGAVAAIAAPAVARAQSWPNGPITWLNPFPAGGGTDVFARPLAAQVGEQIGQQIVIDNKGGAGGTVGGEMDLDCFNVKGAAKVQLGPVAAGVDTGGGKSWGYSSPEQHLGGAIQGKVAWKQCAKF